MEGSWFVTPPPCFTKPNTFDMTTSPLEDMLIEKPAIGGGSGGGRHGSRPRLPGPLDTRHCLTDADQEEGEDDVLLSPVHSSPALMLTSVTVAALQQQEQEDEHESPADADLQRDCESACGSEAGAAAAAASACAEEDGSSCEQQQHQQQEQEEDEAAASLTTSVTSSVNDDDEPPEDDEDENDYPVPVVRTRKRPRRLAPAALLPAASGLRLADLADCNLTQVQLDSYRILSRREGKGRGHAQKRKALRKRQASSGADSDVAGQDQAGGPSGAGACKRSPSSERLVAAIRALAYEPVLQSKAMQDQSQKAFLKSSFMQRQNHVIHHHHHSNHASSRKTKYAARPNNFSTNRKTNRNC